MPSKPAPWFVTRGAPISCVPSSSRSFVRSFIHSFIHSCVSPLHAGLLSAATLAALLLCTSGFPSTDSPDGDPSGEGGDTEWPPDELKTVLRALLGATERHRKEFEDEFQNTVRYDFLDNYRIPSLPALCPFSNFSKEACFIRLLRGLHVYSVLLKYVAQEFPGSFVPTQARHYVGLLITEIEKKMRDPEQVSGLTSSQKEQLLRDVDIADTFHRKMTAHSILYTFHYFLIRGKRVINKSEKPRRGMISKGVAPGQRL
ncbi:interleukin-6-like [Brachionichthys hirsutus]|uniref:interleukin-6-like n=1 Tax=Brachionichthys hirsutus TaxID=412623 RepID=UPI00360524C2